MDVDALSSNDGKRDAVSASPQSIDQGQSISVWNGKGPGNLADSYGWGQNWEPNGYQNQGGQDVWGGCESWGGNADEIDMLQKGKGKRVQRPILRDLQHLRGIRTQCSILHNHR